MKVREILDLVELKIRSGSTEASNQPSRAIVRKYLGWELRKLAEIDQFSFLMKYINPIIDLKTSLRTYDLPADFGDNFVSGAGEKGGEFLCKLNDGTNETMLTYTSPEQFFSKNLEGETDSTPTTYTVLAKADGRRELWISPPPDSTARTLNGVYIPRDWELGDNEEIPPVTNVSVLIFGVLAACDPNPKQTAIWLQLQQQAFSNLMVTIARTRRSQLTPQFDSYYTGNRYEAST